MKFSVIVPARNEEKYIGACLEAVKAAGADQHHDVQIIVVLNRCTDRTEEIAKSFGAHIVIEDAKNLSQIRNAGAKAAQGEIIVTVDADSRMSKNTFTEIKRHLASGKFIGGGTRIKIDRISLGIIFSTFIIAAYAVRRKIPSAGLFWCYKKDFDAIGGFDENVYTVEDLDFAQRLKAHGQRKNLKFGTLWKSDIRTSARKFDKLGDWYFFKNPGEVKALFQGKNKQLANKFYYDFERD